MAKKAETVFKERVLKDLRKLPVSKWQKIQQVSIRGTPDIIGSNYGRTTVIELKASQEDEPDRLQLEELQQWADGGAVAYVAYPENWAATYQAIADYGQKVAAFMDSPDNPEKPKTPPHTH